VNFTINSSGIFPVLGASFTSSDYCTLDLHIGNLELDNYDLSTYLGLENYVNRAKKEKNALVAFGGYGEHRGIYRGSEHFRPCVSLRMQETSKKGSTLVNPKTDRCIHLGIDLWVDAGTPIFAPIDGKVHSFKYNDQHLDYGATIILEHSFMGEYFYLLYGHLSMQSLADKEVGQIIGQGQNFAYIGDRSENGGWVPHLHLQQINDLGEWLGDFPGVATLGDAAKYLNNCPNPSRFCFQSGTQ
jgi:murein DD-endopeptidase MepM/ murein hydrolase activator NlpD